VSKKWNNELRALSKLYFKFPSGKHKKDKYKEKHAFNNRKDH
jgi:hypothetical protein